MKRDPASGLTKREFVKTCALSAGGCILASPGVASLARALPKHLRPTAADAPGKWSKEAMFYRTTSEAVECLKCPHGCVLGEGEVGFCRNRVNHKDKMYTIAYGNPCAVHIDPIEKKPLFHFLPATQAFSIAVAGCNLRCLNCQNWQISQVSPKETENFDLMPEKVVDTCLKSKTASIAYTYSEPTTFYEYAWDTAHIARAEGIKNVWKSSGYINEEPLRRLCKVIDAANIDLKSFDEDIYARLNGAQLAPVLRTLKIFKEEGVWLEITNLVIPNWTDNPEMIKKMCEWLVTNGLSESPLHFSRFHPLYKLNQLPSTPVSTLERARALAVAAGMKYVYIGNVPAHSAENTYCSRCKRMVIERRGFSILQKSIVDGKCRYCGERIPGVWG